MTHPPPHTVLPSASDMRQTKMKEYRPKRQVGKGRKKENIYMHIERKRVAKTETMATSKPSVATTSTATLLSTASAAVAIPTQARRARAPPRRHGLGRLVVVVVVAAAAQMAAALHPAEKGAGRGRGARRGELWFPGSDSHESVHSSSSSSSPRRQRARDDENELQGREWADSQQQQQQQQQQRQQQRLRLRLRQRQQQQQRQLTADIEHREGGNGASGNGDGDGDGNGDSSDGDDSDGGGPDTTEYTSSGCDLCAGRGGAANVRSTNRDLADLFPVFSDYGYVIGFKTCSHLLDQADIVIQLLGSDLIAEALGWSGGAYEPHEACTLLQQLGVHCGCDPAEEGGRCSVCGGQGVGEMQNPSGAVAGTSLEELTKYEPTCEFWDKVVLANYDKGSSECEFNRAIGAKNCQCTQSGGGGGGGGGGGLSNRVSGIQKSAIVTNQNAAKNRNNSVQRRKAGKQRARRRCNGKETAELRNDCLNKLRLEWEDEKQAKMDAVASQMAKGKIKRCTPLLREINHDELCSTMPVCSSHSQCDEEPNMTCLFHDPCPADDMKGGEKQQEQPPRQPKVPQDNDKKVAGGDSKAPPPGNANANSAVRQYRCLGQGMVYNLYDACKLARCGGDGDEASCVDGELCEWQPQCAPKPAATALTEAASSAGDNNDTDRNSQGEPAMSSKVPSAGDGEIPQEVQDLLASPEKPNSAEYTVETPSVPPNDIVEKQQEDGGAEMVGFASMGPPKPGVGGMSNPHTSSVRPGVDDTAPPAGTGGAYAPPRSAGGPNAGMLPQQAAFRCVLPGNAYTNRQLCAMVPCKGLMDTKTCTSAEVCIPQPRCG